MSLDESTYKNPTKFIPERFLSPPFGNGEPHFSCLFGFGRRLAFCYLFVAVKNTALHLNLTGNVPLSIL
jgi:hypothetical protein